MGGLARGGTTPVLIWFSMGLAIEIIAITVHDLGGMAHVLGMCTWILTAIILNFYRDPDRPIPKDDGILVSPADGHVMFTVRERAIGQRPATGEDHTTDPLTGDWTDTPCDNPLSFANEQRWEPVPAGEEADSDAIRVAVFMSPFDVHVNRAPLAATITRMEHRTGKGLRKGPYVPAMRKESAWNERVRTVFTDTDGLAIEVTQISGRLARTIAPWTGEGDTLRRGERYGMIRLGSRVDVRAPASQFEACVTGADAKHPDFPKGEPVLAGSTTLFQPRT